MRANFSWYVDGDILYIEDLSKSILEKGGKSVTNDMENVIEDIREEYEPGQYTFNQLKLIYKDSEGMVDGVQRDKNTGKMIDFYPIGADDFHSAKTKQIKENI